MRLELKRPEIGSVQIKNSLEDFAGDVKNRFLNDNRFRRLLKSDKLFEKILFYPKTLLKGKVGELVAPHSVYSQLSLYSPFIKRGVKDLTPREMILMIAPPAEGKTWSQSVVETFGINIIWESKPTYGYLTGTWLYMGGPSLWNNSCVLISEGAEFWSRRGRDKREVLRQISYDGHVHKSTTGTGGVITKLDFYTYPSLIIATAEAEEMNYQDLSRFIPLYWEQSLEEQYSAIVGLAKLMQRKDFDSVNGFFEEPVHVLSAIALELQGRLWDSRPIAFYDDKGYCLKLADEWKRLLSSRYDEGEIYSKGLIRVWELAVRRMHNHRVVRVFSEGLEAYEKVRIGYYGREDFRAGRELLPLLIEMREEVLERREDRIENIAKISFKRLRNFCQLLMMAMDKPEAVRNTGCRELGRILGISKNTATKYKKYLELAGII